MNTEEQENQKDECEHPQSSMRRTREGYEVCDDCGEEFWPDGDGPED